MSLAVATSPEAINPQASRRTRAPKATRLTSRQGDQKPKKVSFYLSPEAIRRLGIHATMLDTDKSRVVEQLIAEGCRRWVVSDRAKTADQATQEVSES